MTFRYCSPQRQPAPAFPPGLAEERLAALLRGRSLWVNNTVLHYWFFTDDSDASVIAPPGAAHTRRVSWAGGKEQRDVVREAFGQWQDLGIGLTFREVEDRAEAELRIGFQAGGGSWSALGRDALRIGTRDRTMNFGWDLTGSDGRATALHQIGHVLGMRHEHQSPFSGLHFDDEAVYAELAGPPHHWPRERTDENVLRKLDAREANGPVWDPESVMGFPFAPGLVLEPEEYRAGLFPPGTLSAADKEFALRWYPPPGAPRRLVPFRSQPLGLGPGEQADFVVEPEQSRDYTVGLFGDSDAVVVVFEERDGEPRFLCGHDDGGAPHGASVRARFVRGRRYFVRVRLYSAWGSGETALLCW
jgi:hypothetical protein